MMVRKLDDQSRKGESFVDGSNGANSANEYSFMILFMILPAFFSDLVEYIFSFKYFRHTCPFQDHDYICDQNNDVVDLGGLRYGDDHVEVEGDVER